MDSTGPNFNPQSVRFNTDGRYIASGDTVESGKLVAKKYDMLVLERISKCGRLPISGETYNEGSHRNLKTYSYFAFVIPCDEIFAIRTEPYMQATTFNHDIGFHDIGIKLRQYVKDFT
jgi:hypothetical protein